MTTIVGLIVADTIIVIKKLPYLPLIWLSLSLPLFSSSSVSFCLLLPLIRYITVTVFIIHIDNNTYTTYIYNTYTNIYEEKTVMGVLLIVMKIKIRMLLIVIMVIKYSH